MKAILIPGHKADRPGAKNKEAGVSEFGFNSGLIDEIRKKFKGEQELVKVNRVTYKALPKDVNRHKPTFVLSFHCNAFNTEASGAEVLYYHSSIHGKAIAEIFQAEFVGLGLKDRGVKPKGTEDRGGYLLRYVNAPIIILEPFFIDNDDDYALIVKKHRALVNAYGRALEKSFAYFEGGEEA
jgi:N-acetylmuramoyl-L-alanine amidase